VRPDLSAVTTWTGDFLGEVTHVGPIWRSNFGDMRRHLTIKASNGLTYSAIYYLSSGTYCHMKAMK
jgi:hypothetical protein